jgi:rubredoxin
MSPTWKCTICGLVEAGAESPAFCPECGARREMFIPSDEEPHGIAHNPLQPRDALTPEVLGPGAGWSGCLGED